MLKFATLAMVGALSAAGAAQTVVMLSQSGPQVPLRNPQAAMAAAPAGDSTDDAASGQAAEIAKSDDGHYWAEGDVNGTRVRFLVDTGATAVALTAEDAQRLGFDPSRLNFSYKISTANGQQRAAEVRLASVSVAGARVEDVDALVIEKGLPSSLLGMSYLGRLSKFEATRSSLILRP